MKTAINFMMTALLVLCVAAEAQVASNPPFTIEQSVISSGAGTSSGGAGNIYKIEGVIGEPVAGTASSNSPYSVKGGFSFVQPLAPTAAGVSVSGRVTTAAGKGIRNVVVTMTDSSGIMRSTLSGISGVFRFEDVAAGETYIFGASGKRFTFNQPSQIHSITEEVTNIVFIGEANSLQVQ